MKKNFKILTKTGKEKTNAHQAHNIAFKILK